MATVDLPMRKGEGAPRISAVRWLVVTAVLAAAVGSRLLRTTALTTGSRYASFSEVADVAPMVAVVLALATMPFVHRGIEEARGRGTLGGAGVILAAAAPVYVVAVALFLIYAAAWAFITGWAALKVAVGIALLPALVLWVEVTGLFALLRRWLVFPLLAAGAGVLLLFLDALFVPASRAVGGPLLWTPLGHAGELAWRLSVGAPPSWVALAVHAAVGLALVTAAAAWETEVTE